MYARSLKRAVAGAKAEVQALMSRGGMTTGREDLLKRWRSEWTQERLLRAMVARPMPETCDCQREEGARRPSREEGGPDPETALHLGCVGGGIARMRGVGDGADEPG